jgi:hypothetical protein
LAIITALLCPSIAAKKAHEPRCTCR